MYQISRTTPAYYLTSVAHARIPVFRTEAMKHIVCNAFNEARISGKFAIFAYVIMLDHIHLVTSSDRQIKETLRFLNGISAKRILDFLKKNNYESSLLKLRIQEREAKHKYSVYQHHSNAFEIYGEDTLMQKVNYIHQNPVRAGLVEHPNEYLFSSARQWNGKAVENEALVTDFAKINWR